MHIKGLSRSVLAIAASAIALGAVPALSATAASSAGGTDTVHQSAVNSAHPGTGSAGTSNNLYYHGGVPGVETGGDTVYLVYWGSQWTNNDPSGEAAIQQSFFRGVGTSSWNNSVTQYCQYATGTSSCTVYATNPPGVLGGTPWYDNSSAAPKRPSQSQLAAEAVRAAAHFAPTAPGSNNTTQYVISTATRNSASGFGSRYCAWHSSTSSASYGTIAYTNMPYITDAGASCGANFNGLGPNAGITIVGGHEFAETETDIFPNGGWLDSNGAENGDKCAWISSGQGAAATVTFPNGSKFPVQSLWSNASNIKAGGCVLSYP